MSNMHPAIHPMMSETDAITVGISDMWSLVLGIHYLSNKAWRGGAIGRTTVAHSVDRVVMVNDSGIPVLKVFRASGKYAVSVVNSHGSGFAQPFIESKNPRYILSAIKKKAGDTSAFWHSLQNQAFNFIGIFSRAFDAVADNIAGSMSDMYVVRSALQVEGVMWLLRMYTGSVERTDQPPALVQEQLTRATKLFAGTETAIHKSVEGLTRLASQEKWAVYKFGNAEGIEGYIVGAIDCRATIKDKCDSLSRGSNSYPAPPTVTRPFTFYKTLDDVEADIKPDLMSQLHMANISAESSHPQLTSKGLFNVSCHEFSTDAGWMAWSKGLGGWLVVDRSVA